MPQADDISDGVAILSLAFTDPNHGWALTPGQLLELTDGGSHWTENLSSHDAERAFYSLTFINSTLGVIVGTQKKAALIQS